MDTSEPRPIPRPILHPRRLRPQCRAKTSRYIPEERVGNGQVAWKAPEEKYTNHTKEARRACHEKMHNTKMKAGQDPEDFLHILDGWHDLLEGMGQSASDEPYEDIIPQALPSEYERVRTASYEKQNFGLEDTQYMLQFMYTDYLSRPSNSTVADGGIAMQATRRDDSGLTYHFCGNVSYQEDNCVAWKVTQEGGNQHVQLNAPET